MNDTDLEKLADERTIRTVALNDGRTLEGALSRVEDGIYNVLPPPPSGRVGGGMVEDIRAEDIESVK